MSTDVDCRPSVLEVLKAVSAENLIYCLKSIEGTKDLAIDKEVICSLDHIVNFSLIKKCGVEKIFKLEPGSSPGQNQKCVYLIRPTINNARIISDHINANLSIEKERQYWVIYVSRKLYICERIFEREGIFGNITQLVFPLGFVTLDNDIISLEIKDFYKSFFLQENLNYIHTAATSLIQLCNICGPIPKIFGQGRCAKMVIDLMMEMMKEMEFTKQYSDRVSHLIILDRDVDYVSVLLSQLTYEGVLDETFGINNGYITFPEEVTHKEPLKVAVNSSDVVYREIRNEFFASSMFGILKEKSKQLLKAKEETLKMSVQAMKEFINKEMKKFSQQHSSLCLHISACEVIMEKKTEEDFQERLQMERDIIDNLNTRECITYIEDSINSQVPFENPLRLMCLLSVAQNGISSSDYKSLVTQFYQSYGYKHIITIHNLKKAGLLVEQPSLLSSSGIGKTTMMENAAAVTASKIAEKVVTAVAFSRYSSFRTITKKFNLMTNEEETADLKKPQNMNYVFGGAYVPLIGRITEQVIVNDSFKNIEDGLKLLPGSTITHSKIDKDIGHVKPTKDFKAKTVIVFVLGGITYAEVAALKLLEKQNDCRIFIATTSLISGNSLMQMLTPPDT